MSTTYNICSGRGRPLAVNILRRIEAGELQPGQKIDTEVNLARDHHISRMTVRRALEGLIEQKLIERKPGKGIYVHRKLSIRRTFEVVIPSYDNPWLRIVMGAQEYCQTQGVKLQVYNVHGGRDSDIGNLKHLPRTAPSGAID